MGVRPEMLGCGCQGDTPSSSKNIRVKGGDSVRTTIKLLEVITDLIRAISELIREFKR